MTRCRSRAGSSRWAVAPMAAAIIIIPTRWCVAATGSYRWIFMFPAARRRLKLWFMVLCSCRKKSGGQEQFCVTDEVIMMDTVLEAVVALPGVLGARRELGELVVAAERANAYALLENLRDE